MEQRKITEEQIERYRQYLIRDEKSTATVEKYLRDVCAFSVFAGGAAITKEVTVAYKSIELNTVLKATELDTGKAKEDE